MNVKLQCLTNELRNLKVHSFNWQKPHETAGNIRMQLIEAKQADITKFLNRVPGESSDVLQATPLL